MQYRPNHLATKCFVGHRTVEGKPAEMRKYRMWSGRIEEHVEADVMGMERGLLSVVRRVITD